METHAANDPKADNSTNPQEVLARILLAMKLKRIKKSHVCEALGMSPSTFSNWQSKSSKSYMKRIESIADITGTSKDYLLYGNAADCRMAVNSIDQMFSIMKLRKISNLALANAIGVMPNVISTWKARGTVSKKHRGAVEEYLGISLELEQTATPAKQKTKPQNPRASQGGAVEMSYSDMIESMKASGLSRSELATRLGISVASIYNWKTSQSIPQKHRNAIAAILSEKPDKKPKCSIDDRIKQIENRIRADIQGLSAEQQLACIDELDSLLGYFSKYAKMFVLSSCKLGLNV